MQLHDLRNLPQCHLLVVVQAQNGPLDGRHPLNRFRQQFLEFRAFQQFRGPLSFIVRYEPQQVSPVLIIRRRFQTSEIHSSDVDQPLMVFLDRQPQFRRDLFLRRSAMQTLLERRDCRLDLLRPFPLLARSPIEAAQTIQNRPADLVLRIRSQLDVMAWVEVVDRGNQADDARRNQIFQTDALRQPFMDSAGDQPDLRQMLHDELLPLFTRQFRTCSVWMHESLTSPCP